jgi:hypothetical protein
MPAGRWPRAGSATWCVGPRRGPRPGRETHLDERRLRTRPTVPRLRRRHPRPDPYLGPTNGSGFVVNALLVPYLLSAVRMLEGGHASAEDIDTGITLGCAHPLGPLALS